MPSSAQKYEVIRFVITDSNGIWYDYGFIDMNRIKNRRSRMTPEKVWRSKYGKPFGFRLADKDELKDESIIWKDHFDM